MAHRPRTAQEEKVEELREKDAPLVGNFRPRPAGGPGYNLDLPSMPPFMYLEDKKVLGDLAVIAFGAYNAFGLIGPEKGGVAIVTEEPRRSVLATKDIPYNPPERAEEFQRAVGLVQNFLEPAQRRGRTVKILPARRAEEFVYLLREAGYDVRI